MVGSIDPGCEQIRGTHWPNKGRVVDWNSCRGNHLGQRSQNDRINRPDIWTQAIRSYIKKLLCNGGRPHMGPGFRRDDGWLLPSHTGNAIEYFTWLNAKLDSIEAMPSSRVSLFFRNASYYDRSAATTRSR